VEADDEAEAVGVDFWIGALATFLLAVAANNEDDLSAFFPLDGTAQGREGFGFALAFVFDGGTEAGAE